MASLTKNGGIFGLVWTDSSRPKSQVRESLKTKDKIKAKAKKARLEEQYHSFDSDGQRKHDPWKQKWYERKRDYHITIADAVREYLIFKESAKGTKGWNDTTARNERHTMRKFRDMTGPQREITSITEQDLENFYWRPKVNSDHTRQSLYISVNTFLNWALEQDYIESKPHIRPKKPQQKLKKFIWPKDLAILIQDRLQKIKEDHEAHHIKRDDQYSYWIVYGWMILAGTGLRPKELSQLKLHHIRGNSIFVGEGVSTKDNEERWVPLLFEARAAANALTDSHIRSLDPRLADSDLLLGRKPSHSRRALSRQFSQTWQRRFPDKPKRTLYNLKDTFAVRYLSEADSGMAINDLKEILGHASLTTTQKYLKSVPPGTSVRGTIWDYSHELF